MSETWLMNQTILQDNFPSTATFVMRPFDTDTINYTRFANWNLFDPYLSLSVASPAGTPQNPRVLYRFLDDGEPDGTWNNESYRTWEFLEPATGELLNWLQVNGIKQSAGGGIGLKNLSSYNQDLSVPRKKDVDAKQDKITVNGIVQGDGAGNLSAVETVNADLLELNPAAVGLGNVDNVKQYSVSNPPPYPVTSVNGKTGAVTVSALPTVTTADNGKFLRVVNGAWAADTVPSAGGVAF